MIRRVAIRRFKLFDEIVFELPGHVVLAGPNNTGKTTVLQAIAAWDLGFRRWKALNDYQRHGSAYTKAPVARLAFSAVPLRVFDLLWSERDDRRPIEIEIQSTTGWTVTIEFISDSTEQIYVRPLRDADPPVVCDAELRTVYVPPMTGLSIAEPVYQRPKLDQLLGQGKPGDIVRNLLVEAHQSSAWESLLDSIQKLFGYTLLPPDATGADILAEYQSRLDGPRLDIGSAGSGFQQVLMLLSFLHTRPGAVLLLDEPDAHLHVILQDVIYGELRSVAARQNSQLVMATHSEVIINSVEPKELCVLFGVKPRILDQVAERSLLVKSLGVLTQTDVVLAQTAPGVLYVEGHTDIDILREWARVLRHPAQETLTNQLFWRPSVWEPRLQGQGVKARDHYETLKLVRNDLPGLVLLDGDDDSRVTETPITGSGLQRLRWQRYEIENYLVHPTALERFIEKEVGPGSQSAEARKDLLAYLERTLTREFVENPFGSHPLVEAYLSQRKGRTEVLPPILTAAGLPGFPYTRYFEIASIMHPEEIHPEVIEKLDAIEKAFGR